MRSFFAVSVMVGAACTGEAPFCGFWGFFIYYNVGVGRCQALKNVFSDGCTSLFYFIYSLLFKNELNNKE